MRYSKSSVARSGFAGVTNFIFSFTRLLTEIARTVKTIETIDQCNISPVLYFPSVSPRTKANAIVRVGWPARSRFILQIIRSACTSIDDSPRELLSSRTVKRTGRQFVNENFTVPVILRRFMILWEFLRASVSLRNPLSRGTKVVGVEECDID